MEKEKLIKIDKEEVKVIIKSFLILFIISIPFWFFYKNELNVYGLITVIVLSVINHFLSKKYNFLFIEPRLYLSLFIPLIMLSFNII